MKVLLAVDGSEFSKKMLAFLTTHEDMFGKGHQYTVLTVLPPLPLRASAVLTQAVVDSYHLEDAQAILHPIMEFLQRHQLQAQAQHAVGGPGATIAQMAEQGRYDLLVMGSHGHGKMMGMVMGSVASQVLAQCKVPTLLVR